MQAGLTKAHTQKHLSLSPGRGTYLCKYYNNTVSTERPLAYVCFRMASAWHLVACGKPSMSVTKRVIVLLCNKSILGGLVKVTNLPYLEGLCYVTNLLLGGLVLRNKPPIRGLGVT